MGTPTSPRSLLRSDFVEDFSNVCRCGHHISSLSYVAGDEPVRFGAVKTQLCLHQAQRRTHTGWDDRERERERKNGEEGDKGRDKEGEREREKAGRDREREREKDEYRE